MGLILKYTVKAACVCILHIDVCVSRLFWATSSFSPPNLDLLLLSSHSPSVLCCLSLILLLSLSWGVFHYVFSDAMLYSVDLPQTSGGERKKKNTEIEVEVEETVLVIALILSCHTLYAKCVCGCVHLFVFSGCACLYLCSHVPDVCFICCTFKGNKLPNLRTGPEALPFWCLSLFAFILFETYALLSTPLTFPASLLPSLTLPASLSPCEVCDLCNFILPVAGDIS